METVHTDLAPRAIGPYSQAVRAGELLFLSGQIPLDPQTGEIVPGGIREQTVRVLDNVRAVLTAAGAEPGSIVKATIFLTDLADFAIVNELYGEFLGSHRPARSTVQVAALPRGARIELEVIATGSKH